MKCFFLRKKFNHLVASTTKPLKETSSGTYDEKKKRIMTQPPTSTFSKEEILQDKTNILKIQMVRSSLFEQIVLYFIEITLQLHVTF